MGDCCSKKKKMDKYIISSKKSKDFKQTQRRGPLGIVCISPTRKLTGINYTLLFYNDFTMIFFRF